MKDAISAANARFASHVTQVAFNLNLSKSMVFILDCCAKIEAKKTSSYNFYNMGSVGLRDITVPAARHLINRGLIYAPDPDFPGICIPTEAGKHVHALLVLSGLVAGDEANTN